MLWQTDFIFCVIFILTNLCQECKIRNKYLSLIFAFTMSPLLVLNKRLICIIHTSNRISGGDRSDKRETFMPVLLSQFPQQEHIPMFLNLEQTFVRSNQHKVSPMPVQIFEGVNTTKVQTRRWKTIFKITKAIFQIKNKASLKCHHLQKVS